MAEKKRVLFVINTMGVAGAETALLTLLDAVHRAGNVEIDFMSIIPRGELFDKIPEYVNILNKKPCNKSVFSLSGRIYLAAHSIHSLLHKGWYFKNRKYFNLLRAEQKQKSIKAPEKLLWRPVCYDCPAPQKEYDLAIAYIEGASTYYVADRVKAKRKVAFIHTDYQTAGYSRNTDLDAYAKMDKVFLVSEYSKSRFLEIYPEYTDKTYVMHNIIDAEKVTRMANTGEGFTDTFDGTRLVTVGRLHYYKGYDIAVEAMKIMVQRGMNVRWYIVGEGPERQKLENLIEEYNLEDYFVLLGFNSNPYQYVSRCNIYVHATRFEGRSIAIDEAMILCKPIIASDYVANREQIEDGVNGLLTALTPKDIADTVERLATDLTLQEKLTKTLQAQNTTTTAALSEIMGLID